MQKVFSEHNPILKFNRLKTRTDQDEQEGLRFLFAGVVKAIRNTRGH
jgi:uncharacterized protein (TIGR02391 family)